ncbi:MAG TPA: cytochrome c [Sphingomicrobium sp.]|nr:cytochrome c [Sphingomicrobium sp.]
MKHLLLAATALSLLTACSNQTDGNAALSAANASGNEASAALENAVNQSAATPLEKEQALALMKKRHEDYERIGKAMRAAKKGLDGNDLGAVRTAASTINELAPQVQSWFPAGTGPDVGKTEAKAEIWQKPEDFAAKARDFAAAAQKFNAAAQGSDVAAIRAAHADLGKSCKACHDLYREEH